MSMKLSLLCLSIVTPLMLAGCGGGDSSSTAESSPVVISNKVVSATDSPIKRDMGPAIEGVSANLTNDVKVYALTDEGKATNLRIVSNKNMTDGDKSSLIGETFLVFEGLNGTDDTAAVIGGKIKAVYECDLAESVCERAAVSWGADMVSFGIKSNKFYALEKE